MVGKDCIKEGNGLTFNKAKDLSEAEESAEKQLQLMSRAFKYSCIR